MKVWLILWSCENHVILSGRCCAGTQTKERLLSFLLCSAIVYQNCVGCGNPWRWQNKIRCRILRFIWEVRFCLGGVLHYMSAGHLWSWLLVSGLMPLMYLTLSFKGSASLSILNEDNCESASRLCWPIKPIKRITGLVFSATTEVTFDQIST